MNRKSIMNRHINRAGASLFVLCILATVAFVPGCGGGGGDQTGVTHAVTAAIPMSRVTGMVLVQNANAPLARAQGETLETADTGRAVERAASQIAGCGAVPAGFVPVTGATVTVLNETGSTVTDEYGCFQFDIYNMGVKMFTVSKTNSLGGKTILKKAANVQPNLNVRFIDGEDGPVSIFSTVAALIVAKKDNKGETISDPSDLEDYIQSIEGQQGIQDLEAAILAAAGAGQDGLDSIDDSLIAAVEEITNKPAIWDASVTGREVSAAGGSVTISAKAAVFGSGNSVSAVSASLSPSGGGSPIVVALSADNGTNYLYTGSYTFAANESTSVKPYIVTISATDANSVENTYASSTLNIMQGAGAAAVCGNGAQETGEQCDDGNTAGGDGCSAICQTEAPGAMCGNGTQEAGEACDDSNTTTETCGYGETSCTVCDATCQSVAGTVTGYCGDDTTQAGDGEDCDDGNTTTETCGYGETSCTVCDATCQSVAGNVTGYCGDGTMQAGDGETCDDGGTTTGGCVAAYGSTCDYCDSGCVAQTVQGAACGDGAVDAGDGEACDDNNTADGDGCSSTCQIEFVPPVCGNGSVELGDGETYFDEACDDSNTNNADGCNSNCQLEVSQLKVGMYGTICAVFSNGGAKCWGNGGNGQIGNGQDGWQVSPQDVTGLTSGVSQISTDGEHTCAVMTTGGVKCWGYNNDGQLGNGNTTNSNVPVDVIGMSSGVAEVGATDGFTCVLLDDTGFRCWGMGLNDELGDGNSASSLTPVTPTGLSSGVLSFDMGRIDTYVMTAGGLLAWGYNYLGNAGSTPVFVGNITVPTAPNILAAESVEKLSYGQYAGCILTTTGGVKCWGANGSGQLGDGTTTDSWSALVDVTGLSSGVIDLDVNGDGACALLSDHSVKCWGTDGSNGTDASSSVPLDISGMSSGVDKISVGSGKACALKSDGTTWCWGYGPLGDGTWDNHFTPIQIF